MFCLKEISGKRAAPPSSHQRSIAGGIVNCFDPASGRSPLHVAALNGSSKCINILLKSGALVHLRDSLGHTALYYASISSIHPSQHGLGDIQLS